MSETNTQERKPNPVDLYVGRAIRERRKALKISQEKLADQLGLTFQQVQKYERGANRVSASKLYDIAKALQCEVGDLFPPQDPEAAKVVFSPPEPRRLTARETLAEIRRLIGAVLHEEVTA